MKTIINLTFIIFISLNLSSCTTVAGAILDEELGTTTDDGGFFQDIGRAVDEAIDKKNNKNEHIDNIACIEPNTRQVCSALKGCTCEKT